MSAARSARRRPRAGTLATVGAALVVALLAACSAATAGVPERSSGSSPTGPTTAVVADESIHPIATDPAPQLPVTVRSYDGVDVTITDASRIIAVDLYGTLGEIVYTLGLGDDVVGRDRATGFAEAADVPLVSAAGHDLNAESILALDPTVILTDTSIGPPEVQAQLRAAGIPVVFFDPARTLEGIAGHITAVAEALGVPAEGAALVERVEAEIAEALALALTDGEPLRIAFLYLRGTAGVYLLGGPGSGADSMIEAIGAVDVGTDIGLTRSFVTLTSEALVAAAPDVILMLSEGLESIGGVDGLLGITGVAQTPAGAAHRVVDMDDTVLLSFGPRTGATLLALAEAVHGTAR
ncbi:hemin ABC transporter substrate-binding protein [Cellulomonas sp. P22]|uniref:hemin ABC transporter substrate-binding protein n=1 Tax=Cellulomonas sp. P22 TaxID=3373189 RepID=UPI0037B1D033